jgi:murein DD-endopeptidase MepM/ murein hydrolase activator NlpD
MRTKKSHRYTIAIVPDSSQSPIYFSIHLMTVVGSIALVIAMVVGMVFISRHKVGTEHITEPQKEAEYLQASLDSVLSEIQSLNIGTREFDTVVNGILNTVSSAVPSDAPLMADADMDRYFGTSETTDLKHLTAALTQVGDLLSQARTNSELMGHLLTEIPNGWPVINHGGDVSMEFGPNIHPITGQWYMHKGLDIAAYPGTAVVASADGTVVLAEYDPGYGYQVVLRHRYGFSTRYPHMSRILVSEGQTVRQGEAVGTMGMTGIATGTHLHFEVMLGPDVLDPAPFLMISNTFRRGGYGSR